ncbi:MAG: DUF4190 domain-containing protein [Candidatus Omnitrophica bacterium]|nr:DUF4190 domain-containing protein [Candidatus Omnitrophota bacterium]
MFCQKCGANIDNEAIVCVKCGVPTKKEVEKDSGEEKITRIILPVGRSGYAIAAGYLALFSVLLIPAPLALLFGILAVRDIKKNPKKHGMGRAIFGIVMGGVFTALLVLSQMF